MEEIICGRFAEDIHHVNTFLELLALVDSVNSKEAVNQMLQKLLAGFKDDNQGIEDIDCLKLVLLCKLRLELKEKTDGISIQTCRLLVRACLFLPKDARKLVYLDAVEVALWLLNDDDFRVIASDVIKIVQISLSNYLTIGVCAHEDNESSPLLLLKLLEKMIQIFSKRFPRKTLEEHEFQKFLNIHSISDLLVEIAVNDSGILSSNVLTKLIPVVVEASSSYLLLSKLWVKLSTSWKGDNWKEVDFAKTYLVLSSVAYLYFISTIGNEKGESCILVQDNKFWEIILYGIGQKNPTVRKQSRFLLRKALDFMFSNSPGTCKYISTELFFWNRAHCQDYNESWNEYFLILEALEEKQFHLIEPLLIIFEKLVKNSSSCISIAWVLPVYQRMFSHDSNQIVRFGLHSFLSLDVARFVSSNGNIVSFLLYPLLETLNNTYLYLKQDDKEFDVEYSFTKMLSSLSQCSSGSCYSFYDEILTRFSEVSWGPVPLFYLMKSFSSLNLERKVWQKSSLMNLKLFLTNTLHTHSIYIRGAIQSCALKAMVNFLSTENLEIFDLTDVIGAFCQNESLKRGSYSWSLLVEWFKKIFDNDRALKYVSASLSQLNDSPGSEIYVNEKAVARMVILLCDAFLLANNGMGKLEVFYHVMRPILQHLESLDSRPYASDTLVGTAICFLCGILEECSPFLKNDSTLDAVISVVTPLMESMIYYLRKKLFSVKNVIDFNSVRIYLRALNSFVKEKEILSCFLEHSEGLIDDAFHVLELDKEFILCKYFSFQILCLFGDLLVCNRCLGPGKTTLNYRNKLSLFVLHVLKNELLNHCDTIKSDEFNDAGEMNNLKGQIITECIKSLWFMTYCDLKINSRSEEMILTVRDMDLILEDAIESLEIGGKEVLLPVMKVFQVLLPRAMEHSFELSWKFCNMCWRATFEHRKSDFFWSAFKEFIQMVFQYKIMLLSNCEINIIKLSQELLAQSQTVGRIFRLFINHLYHETCKHGTLIWKKYYNVLVDSLTYGPVLRKDQKCPSEIGQTKNLLWKLIIDFLYDEWDKIYKDTCEYIQSFGAEYTVNSFLSSDYISDTSVRIKGISIMLSIMESERRGVPEAKGMTELLADCLGKRVLENIDVKSRYYGNSHVHRLKQRVMQNLLILETSMSKERREQLLVSVCDSLAIESHQPSVKYLQEWLLVRILTRHPDFRGRMWEIFQQVGLKRPGCMGSFIAVMYHLTKTTPQEQLEQFVKECLKHILPCCMAQQFSVRLYAQVVIHKLWELILSCNFEMVVKEYKVAYDCLNSGFDQANNVQKNLKKLKDNFYFHAFHPTDHFSLETIFYEIPRLSNVSTDEWIAISEFEIIKSNTIIPLQNTDNLLKQQSAGEWIAKSNDYSADPTIDKSSNLQKKIMPWKCSDSVPELEFFSEVLGDVNHRNHERDRNREEGLIVVASLIDRMPNLGGLCRTCEAFNVSEYVLGSLKYIEDKQFQNLSVTAENWIPVSEIKPFMLTQYLKSMKEGGYALIGAEQTSNSKRLNDFKFPKKCLLLLGNEKGGIPADLLPLLDECVEIPQQGVIRSLNVHVTGALFVWEYARQNSCCNT